MLFRAASALLLVSGLGFAGCDDADPDAFLSVTRQEIEVEYTGLTTEGEMVNFDLGTNRSWRASYVEEWIHLTHTEGDRGRVRIFLSIDENNTGEDRTGFIIFEGRRRHAPYDSRDAETQGRCTFRYAGEDHRREIGSARNRREGCDLHLHQLRLGNIRRRRQQVDHPCQDFGCSRRREHRPGYRPEYDRRSTYGYVHRYGRFENGDRHRHPESRRTEGFRQQFFSQ